MAQPLKEQLKNTPLVGPILSRVYHYLRGARTFSTSKDYWEQRYRSGGNSGAGSYRQLAQFKAEVLNAFVRDYQVSDVIEFGCGDGNQLQYFAFAHYLGLDVSPAAVMICREKYRADPTKSFAVITDYSGAKADLALSLDVVFHLIEQDVYEHYMHQLFAAAKRYVVIYSSDTESDPAAPISHFKHRKFTTWVADHATQFRLLQHIPNKYPFNGDGENTSVSDFYIYERV